MHGKLKLDWSLLLGFDQAQPAPISEDADLPAPQRKTQLGAKIGGKSGQKVPGFAFGPRTLRRGQHNRGA